MYIQGAYGVERIVSPLAKYEKFAALILISLIEREVGADAFLWPRMFFKAGRLVRRLAFRIDQEEGIDLIAIRTKEQVGLPLQVKTLEKGNGATKFRENHPGIPILFTGKWNEIPPEHKWGNIEVQAAHIVNDSPASLWKSIHFRRYAALKNHLPRYLRE